MTVSHPAGCFVRSHIGRNPEVQRRLQAEIDQVLGGSDPSSLEGLHQLPYAANVIKETLRVSVVGAQTWRVTDREHLIDGGYVLPTDTSLVVPMLSIHESAEYWPQPEAFDPDRFQRQNAAESAEGSLLRFIPFGFGQRMCLGYR
jgi:cytochrome P450